MELNFHLHLLRSMTSCSTVCATKKRSCEWWANACIYSTCISPLFVVYVTFMSFAIGKSENHTRAFMITDTCNLFCGAYYI